MHSTASASVLLGSSAPGYRGRGVLGRPSIAEVNGVRDLFRRIAALLLLEPALDENYDSVKRNACDWPASA
jgi:hypothetical protein